jgi:hypothetical protein
MIAKMQVVNAEISEVRIICRALFCGPAKWELGGRCCFKRGCAVEVPESRDTTAKDKDRRLS